MMVPRVSWRNSQKDEDLLDNARQPMCQDYIPKIEGSYYLNIRQQPLSHTCKIVPNIVRSNHKTKDCVDNFATNRVCNPLEAQSSMVHLEPLQEEYRKRYCENMAWSTLSNL
jgi:hypothetical protein